MCFLKHPRDVGERGHDGGSYPPHFQKGDNGSGGAFFSSIMGDFMVYQDQLETNL